MIHSSLHFLFNIIIIFMDILQLICFVSIITYDYSKFEIINYFINNNWSNNLIKSIKIENNINNEEEIWESPINISFPGIISGCDCSSYNGVIYDEKCATSLLFENCENILPIKKQFFTIIHLPELDSYSFNGIKIKVERYNDLNYLNLLNDSENNDYFINDKCECPKYHEACYDCGIIDSIGNHLCITSYKELKNDCYRIKFEYDYSLKDIPLIKDFEKIFNNIESNFIKYPVEFTNFFQNKSCILQDESITFPLVNYNLIDINNDTSLFINGPKNQGCITKLLYNIIYDYRWDVIYFLSLENLLDDEIKKKLKFLPGFSYDEYIKNNFSLAYRTYNGFGKHCINDINFIIEEIPSFQKNIKIFFIVLLFCALVVFPYYLLLIMVIVQTELLSFYQSFLLGSSYCVIISIYMHFLLIEYDDTKFKYEKLSQIANKFCGDNLTNVLFFSILEDFKNVKNVIHYSIYLTVIMLIMSILKLILISTKAYKKRIMYTLNNGNQIPIGNHNYNIITEVEIQLLN